jgi:hypothetical protein
MPTEAQVHLDHFIITAASGGATIINSDFHVVSMEQKLALSITYQGDQLYHNHGKSVIIETNPSHTYLLTPWSRVLLEKLTSCRS